MKKTDRHTKLADGWYWYEHSTKVGKKRIGGSRPVRIHGDLLLDPDSVMNPLKPWVGKVANYAKAGKLRPLSDSRRALRDKRKAEKIVMENCAECEFDAACRDTTCPAHGIHARIKKEKR